MKKITYIISQIDRVIMFEWIVEKINTKDFSLSFILLNPGPSSFEDFLKAKGIEVHRIKFQSKRDWPNCFMSTMRLLKKIKPDVVHTHFFDANVIGLSAAKFAGVPNRIYTRHHSSWHHMYFKKGVWWDKLANRLATKIVAISGLVKKVLEKWEKANPEKIVTIPHGIQVKDFECVDAARVEKFRTAHNLISGKYVVGVISRLFELKGVQYIIPAFKNFLKEKPDAVLLILNAQGDYAGVINQLLEDVPAENYRLIPFERDIPAAYKSFDVFVHVPIEDHLEAFGLVYTEALAAGVPSIFTLSGVAPDFIRNRYNAMTVPFKDDHSIFLALKELSTNQSLCRELAENGSADVRRLFPVEKMISQLEDLYKN